MRGSPYACAEHRAHAQRSFFRARHAGGCSSPRPAAHARPQHAHKMAAAPRTGRAVLAPACSLRSLLTAGRAPADGASLGGASREAPRLSPSHPAGQDPRQGQPFPLFILSASTVMGGSLGGGG